MTGAGRPPKPVLTSGWAPNGAAEPKAGAVDPKLGAVLMLLPPSVDEPNALVMPPAGAVKPEPLAADSALLAACFCAASMASWSSFLLPDSMMPERVPVKKVAMGMISSKNF